jgi:large subunit ribosomal protein L1
MDTKKVLEEIRKEKKRKFVQTVDLVVNLKEFDVRKEALNTFVTLPHSSEKKIGAFLTKKSDLVDSITEADFTKYKELNDMKKLAKQYDFFIAVAPMMGKIATKFGRVFGPAGKMPSPQAGIIVKEDDASIKAMLDKMNKVVRIRTKEMSIKVPIGKEDMKDSDLEENVASVLKQLEKHLPRGPENIKNASLKFTMSKSIKFLDRARKVGGAVQKISEVKEEAPEENGEDIE